MNNYFQIIILVIFNFQVINGLGQAEPEEFDEPVLLDESVTYGKLSNGLSYYIKHLPESQDKINLRFYIKVGSNHQDSDELNFSHFVEHMAFKSSKHFPEGIFSTPESLQRMNMSLYDLNGSAGVSFTRYRFDAPPGNKKALETGLLWFKDIAGGLHFKEKEIDTERGVLIQELIRRSGDNLQETFARNNLRAALFPCSQTYSNFIEHHETFNPARLEKFYNDWYRPDLMALVIVGKIDDVDALEKEISERFSVIRPVNNPRNKPDCDSLFFDQPHQFAIVEDKGASIEKPQTIKTELFFRNPGTRKNISNIDGLKRMKKINVLVDIINKRFRERTDVYSSFYNTHMRHTVKTSRAPSSFLLTIDSDLSREKNALQETFLVLRQFQQYGVLESEFKAAIDKQLGSLTGITTNQARFWLKEIENHFVYDEAFPENKITILKKWLADLSLAEFNEFINSFDFNMPEDIGIIAPPYHKASSFSQAQVRSWIRAMGRETISAYTPPEIPDALVSVSLRKELHENNFENFGTGVSGARELVLGNGVRVILKPIKPSHGPLQEKIIIHGFNNKGASAYSPLDYFSAVNAPRFIKNSGVGEFDKFDLQRYLSTTSLSLDFLIMYINNQEAGIKVDGKLVDLEEMLQLVYLYFSEPRMDAAAFNDWKTQEAQFYHKYGGDSKLIDLNNNIKKILGDNSGTSSGTERYLGIEETDMKRGLEIFKDLFGNARDFTFIISGDFLVDSITPLVNKYLGNLPVEKDIDRTIEIQNSFNSNISGPVLVQFRVPEFHGKINYMYKPLHIVPLEGPLDWKELLRAEALGRVLNSMVLNLRLSKGYSLYTVNAYSVYNMENKYIEFGAQIDCTPEEYPMLRREFSNIINKLKSDLVSEDMLKQSLKRLHSIYDPEGNANTHRVIQEKLYNHYRHNLPWKDTHEILPFIKTLTPEDILQAAKEYFKKEYFYEFVTIN